MITQQWSLYYQAITGRDLEAPESGDQTPPLRSEPATWMWVVPLFQGSATEYTEQPEAGDQTFENRAEPHIWIWAVPLFVGDSTTPYHDVAVEVGDLTPHPLAESNFSMWVVALFLGESTQFTEQPEVGDQTHEERTSPQIWIWSIPYFLVAATDYTEEPESGDLTPPIRHASEIWMWAVPFYLGDSSIYTEQPEMGDFYPHPLETNLWTWTIPYFLGDSTIYTEEPEIGQEGWRPAEDGAIYIWRDKPVFPPSDIGDLFQAIIAPPAPEEIAPPLIAVPWYPILLKKPLVGSASFVLHFTMRGGGYVEHLGNAAASIRLLFVGQGRREVLADGHFRTRAIMRADGYASLSPQRLEELEENELLGL